MKPFRLVAAALALALTFTVVSAFPFEQPAAQAADGRQFDPGDIISDALFFDGAAMNAADIQTFLNGKVSSCRSGYTCLKDYRQSTTSKAAVSGRCNAYAGAANELASAIIAKVGAACGISQKALIVLLEKEQGLVTDDFPGSGQYRSATGYGCPDTAVCDSQYYGFFNQVYNAALQFKRYAATPTSWNHVAGRVNAVRFSPNAACGSSNVFIQNQATAGLYNYTPYQPNAAALANLYGTGDGCSSYGNRNFWRMYTDWFGSTIAGTSLLRTMTDPTVYVVSGTNKYPIANAQMLAAYSPLGQVGYVSAQYLSAYKTMQFAGRVIRSPGGTIYFTDAGLKLSFTSCGLVVDYGGRCDATGFVQLTDEQLSHFAPGPTMGPVLGTTAGARYYITAGTKREILDDTSEAAAGLPAGFNVLTENAVSTLPYGNPVIRDSVFVAERGTSNYSYLGNAARYPVDAIAVAGAGLPKTAAGSLSTASLAKIPAGATTFSGMVTTLPTDPVSILTAAGRYTWSGSAALPAVTVPQAFLDAYPSVGSIAAGASVKTAGSATVYIVMTDKILPVGAWDSLLALNAGKTPTITTVPDALVGALPKGPVALTAGSLVRTPTNATVYLVNGVTSKIALSDFVFTTEAGITAWTMTTQARLDAYPLAPTLMGFGVACGTQNYVSAGGALHGVSKELQPAFPFTYVPLDQFTCALLKVASPATAFIRVPDGSIYFLEAGQKRPITSMARFVQLSQGKPYLNVVAKFAAAIPTGPAA
ncbi:hypothetical protein G3T36_14180 [Diaminobutyricibacter tongyongensis]|uniref:Hemagglutinin n=1 Tax=Leifsonia tongyongensis TaxID=1268043 RepID=A0A6L9Y005_9MICO|nr:hypothetical protein [Diaminobutyricibacter tongyongensis]